MEDISFASWACLKPSIVTPVDGTLTEFENFDCFSQQNCRASCRASCLVLQCPHSLTLNLNDFTLEGFLNQLKAVVIFYLYSRMFDQNICRTLLSKSSHYIKAKFKGLIYKVLELKAESDYIRHGCAR